MGLISLASNRSAWLGHEYYEEKKVKKYKQINEDEYEGTVAGSGEKHYHVFLNIKNPRKSKCDCPFAKDKRIICKHLIALFFTIFPQEVDKYLKEIEESRREAAQWERELHKKVEKCIKSLSKEELRDALFEILYYSPEWVFDRFVRDRIYYKNQEF